MKELVTIYNQPQAHFIKSMLADNGIESFLFNENFSVIEGGLGFAGIKINVNEANYQKALTLLNDYQKSNEEE